MKLLNNHFFLDIVLEDKFGVPSVVSTNEKLVQVDTYKGKILKNKLFQVNENIKLVLEIWQGHSAELRDFHKWNFGWPRAYTIVCSPRFRSVLEKLHLPPHRFYPAEIDVLGKTEHYFVLHFLFEYLDLMNFEQSVFARAELMKTEPVEKRYKKGEISDKDHYNTLNVNLIDNDKWIFPKHIVFPKNVQYDIFALGGSIVLTEKAKQEIEKAQITGLTMPPLDENDYWRGVEIEFTGTPVKYSKTNNYSTKEKAPANIAGEPTVEYRKKK